MPLILPNNLTESYILQTSHILCGMKAGYCTTHKQFILQLVYMTKLYYQGNNRGLKTNKHVCIHSTQGLHENNWSGR